MKIKHVIIAGLLLACQWVAAQTTSTATVPADKLVSSYTGMAGTRENAASLVNGLRTGSDITLMPSNPNPNPDGSMPASATFSPTTKPMGYGNIRIALSLAQTRLASQGITNPTPQQLQGALVGTPGDTTQGVLQMRASGMGWGQIANSMGVKLGTVMSGKPVPTTATTATTAGTATTRASASASYGSSQAHKGIVTAAGVTTASGASAGGGVTTGAGNAYGHGNSGVVNAGGGKAGGVGAAAGGNGKGGGKP